MLHVIAGRATVGPQRPTGRRQGSEAASSLALVLWLLAPWLTVLWL